MIRLSGESNFVIPGVRAQTIESISIDYCKQLKHDPSLYRIDVVEEPNIWKVNFLPKDESIMGGGFQLKINKTNLRVIDVVFFQ